MKSEPRKTYLFSLRIWAAEREAGQLEWRGRLQSLPDGDACYFRDWPGLLARLEALLVDDLDEQGPPADR